MVRATFPTSGLLRQKQDNPDVFTYEMKMSEKYVLTLGGSSNYYRPFQKFGKHSTNRWHLNQPEKINLVVFTGGADISPALYNHSPSRSTCCQPQRDVAELLAFRKALKHNLPMFGICRGAQFLCAMAGGTLIQHVSGHEFYGGHMMRTSDDRRFHITSTHHQMQNPPPDAIVLGWADPYQSNVYIGQNNRSVVPPTVEYECVYYPSINAVGVQYHPEIMFENSCGFRFAEELVETYLIKRPACPARLISYVS